MTDGIALIAIDWGTSNRRAWALARDGRIADERRDAVGLLSVQPGGFFQAFTELTTSWRNENDCTPALMCGMVGSKLGWSEVPYLPLPLDLKDLARAPHAVPGVPAVWIVPGACDDQGPVPDVMRGEECQILGAMIKKNIRDAIFALPGTHSKWAVVKAGRLVRFRTYMTGELFSLLSSSGTIAQLIEPGDRDPEAFDSGVARMNKDRPDLAHALFGVRTLGLLARMARTSLSSYLSGLLVGAEIADAVRWIAETSLEGPILAIGSPQLLANYDAAARHFGIAFEAIDSSVLVPPALFTIARIAGLMSRNQPFT